LSQTNKRFDCIRFLVEKTMGIPVYGLVTRVSQINEQMIGDTASSV